MNISTSKVEPSSSAHLPERSNPTILLKVKLNVPHINSEILRNITSEIIYLRDILLSWYAYNVVVLLVN
jgi:hypothetical protein